MDGKLYKGTQHFVQIFSIVQWAKSTLLSVGKNITMLISWKKHSKPVQCNGTKSITPNSLVSALENIIQPFTKGKWTFIWLHTGNIISVKQDSSGTPPAFPECGSGNFFLSLDLPLF